jgi:F-type H+-transporting ATPase subunit 8
MPQALPFYFAGQAVYVLVTLAVLVYIMSVFVLPAYLHLFVTRIYVTKL